MRDFGNTAGDKEFLKRNNGYESPARGFTNLGQRFLASNDISLPSVREPLAAEMAAINASSHVRSFNGGYRGGISGARLSMKCRHQNHFGITVERNPSYQMRELCSTVCRYEMIRKCGSSLGMQVRLATVSTALLEKIRTWDGVAEIYELAGFIEPPTKGPDMGGR